MHVTERLIPTSSEHVMGQHTASAQTLLFTAMLAKQLEDTPALKMMERCAGRQVEDLPSHAFSALSGLANRSQEIYLIPCCAVSPFLCLALRTTQSEELGCLVTHHAARTEYNEVRF